MAGCEAASSEMEGIAGTAGMAVRAGMAGM